MDDADPHQRRQPDRRAAVIGKAEKRAAIRDEAAMQRDPVHRSRHGMLADAVMDVAAIEGIGPHRLLRLGARQVGMGQIGRAAKQIRQRLGDHVDHQLRRLPGGDFRPFGAEPDRVSAPSRRHIRRAAFDSARHETATVAVELRRLRALDPAPAGRMPAAHRFRARHRLRPPESETARAASPARRASSSTSSAPSGAPCAFSVP